MATTVVPADFKLPIGLATLGLAVTGAGNIGAGFPMTVVGLLLALQASRVSFMFDNAVIIFFAEHSTCRRSNALYRT